MPIADYAIVGNGFSCALISLEGSIDWLCWPAFDSPSCFGGLLDPVRGGYFAISVEQEVRRRTRRYQGLSFILETEIQATSGRLRRIELMTGSSLDAQAVLRRIEVVEGEVAIIAEIDVRPDYALHVAEPVASDQGFAFGDIHLQSPPHLIWDRAGSVLRTRHVLTAGETLDLVVSNTATPWYFDSERSASYAFWAERPPIAGRNGRYGPFIERSAQLITLLTYRPTGALLAAATTSLPERKGADRNYDYRYVWLRDMAFVIMAMLPRGHFQRPAKRFIDWFVMNCLDLRRRVPNMFPIDAPGDVRERILAHLGGYADSRPVRIGNAAAEQFQLDSYGELLQAVKLYADHVGALEWGWWPGLTRLADDLCRHWAQPDWGIWEERSQPRQYLYSKAMTWVGLEAAIALALRFHLPGNVSWWQENARAVHAHIDDNYWNADRGLYAAVAAGDQVDPSALLLALFGVVPIQDERARQTALQIERDLGANGLVYRRLEDESSRLAEGTFNLCTLWLVIYWARVGDKARAAGLFDGFLAHANDVLLFSEEIDPVNGDYLGNYPQLFVHAALIVAADALEEAS